MKVTTQLVFNSGFRWMHTDNLSVQGYVIDNNEGYIKNEKLCDYFKAKLTNCRDYTEFFKNIDGSFSIIYSTNKFTLIFSDKTRFFPLFYKEKIKELIITDNPSLLVDQTDEIDLLSEKEFRYTGFVTGNRTLYQDIKQVQAAELLIITDDKIESSSTFTFRVKKEEKIYYDNPKQELAHKIDKAFDPILKSLNDKTPILPLSGGFDSRLIACKLKEAGFNNTICFTYGRPGKEVELSKRVAERLNFKWYFIDYENLISGRNLLLEEEFQHYFRFASRYTSMFYLQEFPAVEYLKNNKIIPENSVFLPGHSGDGMAGSQFVKMFLPGLKPSNVAAQIIKTKYSLFPLKQSYKNKFIDIINEQLGEVNEHLGYSIYEDWEHKEKFAKFIFNSSQVFSYFGYETRFPFWNNELLEFFRTLPHQYRLNKILYDSCLHNYYFKKHNVSFNDEFKADIKKIRFQKFKDFIKQFLPEKIVYSNIRKNDWLAYYEMSLPMLNDLDENIKRILPYINFNSVLINWYLKKIREESKQQN